MSKTAISLLVLSMILSGVHSHSSIISKLEEQRKLISFSTPEQKCAFYETALRQAYDGSSSKTNLDELLKRALGEVDTSDASGTVYHEMKQCFESTSTTVDTGSDDLPIFDRSGLLALSKIQQTSKVLPLDQRCRLLEETLREVVKNKKPRLYSANKPTLFQSAIQVLSSRQLPFGNNQPVLIALKECVEKLSDYQMVVGPQRTVIAGPFPSEHQVKPESPMERIRDEFHSVKNNIKDFGQDLYNKEAHLKKDEHSSEHGDEHGEYLDIEYDSDLDDKSGYYDEDHLLVGKDKRHPNENIYNQLNEERARSIKLEKMLEHEHLIAAEREKQLANLQRELKQTQQLLQEQIVRNDRLAADEHDHYDDDDDDDSDSDDDEHDLGDIIKGIRGKDKRNKKDKKKEKKEKEKDKKKSKKEKEEKDDDKVYKGTVDIARKLQDRMNSSESLENRCQKYYIALNYPGKVNKKFLKILSKLKLPQSTIQNPQYYEALDDYVQALTNSKEKYSDLAAREIEQCLINFSNNDQLLEPQVPLDHVTHQHQNQIPVVDARTHHNHQYQSFTTPLAPSSANIGMSATFNSDSGPQEIPVSLVNSRRNKPQTTHNYSYSRSFNVGGSGSSRSQSSSQSSSQVYHRVVPVMEGFY